MTAKQIWQAAEHTVLSTLSAWLPGFASGRKKGDELWITNPTREDTRPGSFSINTKTGLWHDFATNESGNVLQLYAAVHGIDIKQATQKLVPHQKTSNESGRETIYQYSTAKNEPLFQVRRIDYPNHAKKIYTCYYDENNYKRNQMPKRFKKPKSRPLYKLQKITANPHTAILLVEGEKCVHAFDNLTTEFIVTTWAGGANAINFTDFSPLKNRNLILWPDNDSQGRDAMKKISLFSELKNSHIKFVDVSNLPEKSDVADIMAKENGQAAALEMIFSAAPAPESDTADMWITEIPIDEYKETTLVKSTGEFKPKETFENFEILYKHYGMKINYNVMTKQNDYSIINNPERNERIQSSNAVALSMLKSLSNRNNKVFSTETIGIFEHEAARKNAYHPIQQIVDTITPDGNDYIQHLADSIVCKKDFPDTLKMTLIKKWLMQAIAAVYWPKLIKRPGLLQTYEKQFRGRIILTLQGNQGIGKTSLLRNLCTFQKNNTIEPIGFGEGINFDVKNKDSIETVIQNWIVELGELEATFRRSDIASLKAFVTKPQDQIRLPYAKRAEFYPRSTVFCASVNQTEFLNDPTGSTRFGILPVESINLNAVPNAGQLWRQVLDNLIAKMTNKEQHLFWLTPDEEKLLAAESQQYNEASYTDELIASYYDGDSDTGDEENLTHRMTAAEILAKCNYTYPKRTDVAAMNKTLEAQGFKYKRSQNIKKWIVNPNNFSNVHQTTADTFKTLDEISNMSGGATHKTKDKPENTAYETCSKFVVEYVKSKQNNTVNVVTVKELKSHLKSRSKREKHTSVFSDTLIDKVIVDLYLDQKIISSGLGYRYNPRPP